MTNKINDTVITATTTNRSVELLVLQKSSIRRFVIMEKAPIAR